ncbi:hypothetical protein ACFPYJ_18115 [Paenibacillus solisilvae]|uniref:Uncharacterized protein n=1 Tax=Paenibacillus solisilvae TaxID=2486751 RepID=A0ABW0VZC7_9BACL
MMSISEDGVDPLDELTNILKNALSIELRVENSIAEQTIACMAKYDFRFKNSWSSVELPDHMVIDFWKNEFFK